MRSTASTTGNSDPTQTTRTTNQPDMKNRLESIRFHYRETILNRLIIARSARRRGQQSTREYNVRIAWETRRALRLL